MIKSENEVMLTTGHISSVNRDKMCQELPGHEQTERGRNRDRDLFLKEIHHPKIALLSCS